MWAKIKVTVTRCERVYEHEFGGDKERFFSFFAVSDVGSSTLRPYRKIAEAIPQMHKDLQAERGLDSYHDGTDTFSEPRWQQRWGGRNSWEVWRALEKEHYPLSFPSHFAIVGL
jgi:hypothetical protein